MCKAGPGYAVAPLINNLFQVLSHIKSVSCEILFIVISWCTKEYVKITLPDDLEETTEEIRELLDDSIKSYRP